MHIVRNKEKHEYSQSVDSVEVSPFIPSNWYSDHGAKKKLHALEKKGLPSFQDWRFLTLTVDGIKFNSPESAYNHIKPRMRYFFRSLKDYLKTPDLQYLWKLEFQENGMPHWHCLINYKQKIPVDVIFKLWDYGYTKIERCNSKKLPYTFKYICKQTESLPSWFLALKRPRVFQSSGIFPKATKSVEKETDTEEEPIPSVSAPLSTLGERLNRYQNTVVFKKQGKPYATFYAGMKWSCSFLLLFKLPNVVFLNPYCLEVPTDIINRLTQ